jgi:predicted membrane chloride channel (bestrophin family)
MTKRIFAFLGARSDEELVFYPEQRAMLRQMAASLADAGANDAALDTEAMVIAVEHALRQVALRRDRLDRVWHALEWHRSGAMTEDQFRAALAAYREGS